MSEARSRFPARALQRLLRPRSVAVVGASATPGALGTAVIANLERSGFTGDVHLINPNRDRIGARFCLKSVEELPSGVDVAVLAIPRTSVVATVAALGRREVGAAIIFSAGFAEDGERGKAEQSEIAGLAADFGMIIEGPNCLGLVNYVNGVALTFVETPAAALGNQAGIGIVSQSGAMAAVLSVMLTSRALGISYSISTGNEAVSGVEDYIDYLIADPHTRSIGLIVEQIRRPRWFLQLARRARDQGKQIVLLHPGRSGAARESAATHTGAMAGDYAVMRTQVEAQGVLIANSLEELGDLLDVVMRCRSRFAPGTAVLTESGAFKALTLDLCEELGLALPVLSNDNAPLLRAALPAFVPVSNPVDLTAQGLSEPDLYRRTLAALLQDDRVGSVVLGIIQTDATTSNIKFPSIISAIHELGPQKPVIFAGLDEGAAVPNQYIAELRAQGVPYFPSPDRALRAVARLSELCARDGMATSVSSIALTQPFSIGVVPEYRAKQLLAPLGIPFTAGRLVTNLDDAQAVAREIGFPVALKAQSTELSHKSDAGGVVLNLSDDRQLALGWERLHQSLATARPGMQLDGVLVERMARRGTEVIVGARNDPDWGPVVLVGLGGVQAEIFKDVRLMPAELGPEGILRELTKLKSAALLQGFRGSPALDVAALADLVTRVGQLVCAEPDIREIDLNPVLVYPVGEGAIALDALMLVAPRPAAVELGHGRQLIDE